MSESLEVLNRRLADYYGSEGDEANWRVVWSPDQVEDRHAEWSDYTTDGLFIRTVTETRRVLKYNYFQPSWILEALREVPIVNMLDLPDKKLSYEILYRFPYREGKPLFPIWPVLKFIIDGVNEKVGITIGARYKDPMSDPKIADEVKEAKLQELEQYLWPDETDLGDALAYGEAVGYTGPPKISSTIEGE